MRHDCISPFHLVNSLFLKIKYNSKALNAVEDPKQNRDDYFDAVIQYVVENLDLDMTSNSDIERYQFMALRPSSVS